MRLGLSLGIGKKKRSVEPVEGALNPDGSSMKNPDGSTAQNPE